jgi:hypothetical protein
MDQPTQELHIGIQLRIRRSGQSCNRRAEGLHGTSTWSLTRWRRARSAGTAEALVS